MILVNVSIFTRGRENRAVAAEEKRQVAEQGDSGRARGRGVTLEQLPCKPDVSAEERLAALAFPAYLETDGVLSLGNKMKFLHKKN